MVKLVKLGFETADNGLRLICLPHLPFPFPHQSRSGRCYGRRGEVRKFAGGHRVTWEGPSPVGLGESQHRFPSSNRRVMQRISQAEYERVRHALKHASDVGRNLRITPFRVLLCLSIPWV